MCDTLLAYQLYHSIFSLVLVILLFTLEHNKLHAEPYTTNSKINLGVTAVALVLAWVNLFAHLFYLCIRE